MSCIIILLIIILILLSIWGIWELVKYFCNCKKELYKTEELKNIKMNRLNNIDGVNGIEHSSGEEGVNKLNIPEKNFFLPFSDNENIDKQLSIVNSFKNVLYKDAFVFFSLNISDRVALKTQQSFDNSMDYRVPVIADDINQPSVGIRTRGEKGSDEFYNGVMDFCVLDLQDFNAVNDDIYNEYFSIDEAANGIILSSRLSKEWESYRPEPTGVDWSFYDEVDDEDDDDYTELNSYNYFAEIFLNEFYKDIGGRGDIFGSNITNSCTNYPIDDFIDDITDGTTEVPGYCLEDNTGVKVLGGLPGGTGGIEWFKDKLTELSRSSKLLDIIFGKEMQTIQADGKITNFSNNPNIDIDTRTPGLSRRNLPLTYISNSTTFPDNDEVGGCNNNMAVKDNYNTFFASEFFGKTIPDQSIRQIKVVGKTKEDVNKISKMQYGKLTLPPFTYSLMIGVDNIRNVKNALLVSNMKPTYLLEGDKVLNDSIYLPSYYLTTLSVYRSTVDSEFKSLEESDVDYNNWNNKLLNNNFLPYEKIRPFNTYVIVKETISNIKDGFGLQIDKTVESRDNWFYGDHTVTMCGQEILENSPYNITTIQTPFGARLTEIQDATCGWFEKKRKGFTSGLARAITPRPGGSGPSVTGCKEEEVVDLDINCVDYRLLPPYMEKSGWYNYMFKWNDVYEFNIKETISEDEENFLYILDGDDQIGIYPTPGAAWDNNINSVVVADCIPVYLFLKYLYREFILPDVETYGFDVKKFIEKEGPGVIDKYFLYKPGSDVNEINYEKSIEMFTKMYNSPQTQFGYFSYINFTPEVLNYVNTSITFNTSVSIENVLYPYVNKPEMRNNAISLNILFTQLSNLYYTLVSENLIIRPTTNLPFAFPFKREDFIELAFNSMTNISNLDMPDYNFYSTRNLFSVDTELLLNNKFSDCLKIYDYFRDELSKGSSSNEEWTNRLILWYNDNIKNVLPDADPEDPFSEFSATAWALAVSKASQFNILKEEDEVEKGKVVRRMTVYLRDSKESVNNFVYFIKNTKFYTNTESRQYTSNFNIFSEIKLFYNGILNFITDNLEYPFFTILDYIFRSSAFPYTGNTGITNIDFINFRDIFVKIDKAVVIFRREKSYQLTVDYATSVLNCYINLSLIQQSSLEFVSDNGYKSFINDSTFNNEETIYEKVLVNTENPIDSFPKLSVFNTYVEEDKGKFIFIEPLMSVFKLEKIGFTADPVLGDFYIKDNIGTYVNTKNFGQSYRIIGAPTDVFFEEYVDGNNFYSAGDKIYIELESFSNFNKDNYKIFYGSNINRENINTVTGFKVDDYIVVSKTGNNYFLFRVVDITYNSSEYINNYSVKLSEQGQMEFTLPLNDIDTISFTSNRITNKINSNITDLREEKVLKHTIYTPEDTIALSPVSQYFIISKEENKMYLKQNILYLEGMLYYINKKVKDEEGNVAEELNNKYNKRLLEYCRKITDNYSYNHEGNLTDNRCNCILEFVKEETCRSEPGDCKDVLDYYVSTFVYDKPNCGCRENTISCMEDTDCGVGEDCVNNNCMKRCEIYDIDCEEDAECDEGECINGKCGIRCDNSQICNNDGYCESPCIEGEDCVNNNCMKRCEIDDDCGDNEMCGPVGYCEIPCKTDEECPYNNICKKDADNESGFCFEEGCIQGVSKTTEEVKGCLDSNCYNNNPVLRLRYRSECSDDQVICNTLFSTDDKQVSAKINTICSIDECANCLPDEICIPSEGICYTACTGSNDCYIDDKQFSCMNCVRTCEEEECKEDCTPYVFNESEEGEGLNYCKKCETTDDCYQEFPGEKVCVDGICEISCISDTDCPGEKVCINGTYCSICDELDNKGCSGGKTCFSGVCAECVSNRDCDNGKICNNEVVECDEDGDCAEGRSCKNGYCEKGTCEECVKNNDCLSFEECVKNKCVDIEFENILDLSNAAYSSSKKYMIWGFAALLLVFIFSFFL